MSETAELKTSSQLWSWVSTLMQEIWQIYHASSATGHLPKEDQNRRLSQTAFLIRSKSNQLNKTGTINPTSTISWECLKVHSKEHWVRPWCNSKNSDSKFQLGITLITKPKRFSITLTKTSWRTCLSRTRSNKECFTFIMSSGEELKIWSGNWCSKLRTWKLICATGTKSFKWVYWKAHYSTSRARASIPCRK